MSQYFPSVSSEFSNAQLTSKFKQNGIGGAKNPTDAQKQRHRFELKDQRNMTAARCRRNHPKPSVKPSAVSPSIVSKFWNPMVSASQNKQIARFPFQHVFQYQQQFAQKRCVTDVRSPQLQFATNLPQNAGFEPNTSGESLKQILPPISNNTTKVQCHIVNSGSQDAPNRVSTHKLIFQTPSTDFNPTYRNISNAAERINPVSRSVPSKDQSSSGTLIRSSNSEVFNLNTVVQPLPIGHHDRLIANRNVRANIQHSSDNLKKKGLALSPQLILNKDVQNDLDFTPHQDINHANSVQSKAYRTQATIKKLDALGAPWKLPQLVPGESSSTIHTAISRLCAQQPNNSILNSIVDALEKTSQDKVSFLRRQLVNLKEGKFVQNSHIGIHSLSDHSNFIHYQQIEL